MLISAMLSIVLLNGISSLATVSHVQKILNSFWTVLRLVNRCEYPMTLKRKIFAYIFSITIVAARLLLILHSTDSHNNSIILEGVEKRKERGN